MKVKIFVPNLGLKEVEGTFETIGELKDSLVSEGIMPDGAIITSNGNVLLNSNQVQENATYIATFKVSAGSL